MIVKPIIEIVNKNFSQNIEKLVNEYSYPLIIVVINSGVLPLTVYYLSLFEMHYKKSYREKSILIKSFFFLLINSIIIPSLKHDELSLMLSKLKDFNFDKKDFDLFAPFIDNSYFFCRYIIQVTFLTNTLQLFAFPTFFVKKFKFFIANSDFEKVYALVIKKYFDLGFNYSFALIVFLMTLIFSTTIPIIVPFGCLFFYIKYNFDRYNLIFFYPVEFEGEGDLGEIVIKLMLFAIFFFQIVISGLFYVLAHNKENNKLLNFISFLYIVIAIILYFISKSFFSKNSSTVSSKLFEMLNEEEQKELDLIEIKDIEIDKKKKFKEKENKIILKNNEKIVQNTDLIMKNFNANNKLAEISIKEVTEKEGDFLFDEVRQTTARISLPRQDSIRNTTYMRRFSNVALIEKCVNLFKDAYVHPIERRLMSNSFFDTQKFSNADDRTYEINHELIEKVNEEFFILREKTKNKGSKHFEIGSSNLFDEILEDDN